MTTPFVTSFAKTSNPPSATVTASGVSADAVSTTTTDRPDSRTSPPDVAVSGSPDPDVASPAPPPPAGSISDPSDAGGATRLFDSKRFRIVDGRLVRITKAAADRDRRQKEAKRLGAVRVAVQRLKVATPAAKEQMAAMKATGMSDTAISRAFGVHSSTITRLMSAPEMVATIEKQRAFFRAIATEQAADVILDTFGRIRGALENDDPKAFDAYTRGLAALERTGASASGENKPASVNVAVGVQTSLSADERAELLREFRKTMALEGDRA